VGRRVCRTEDGGYNIGVEQVTVVKTMNRIHKLECMKNGHVEYNHVQLSLHDSVRLPCLVMYNERPFTSWNNTIIVCSRRYSSSKRQGEDKIMLPQHKTHTS
jgi:hypothetical protein